MKSPNYPIYAGQTVTCCQEKRIRPVGSDTEIDVDFRVISASHQDLDALVQQGKFRQDLFFRIHVMDLVLPPCVSAARYSAPR